MGNRPLKLKKGFISGQDGNRKGIVKGRKKDTPLKIYDNKRDSYWTDLTDKFFDSVKKRGE
tara:strand:+ start:33 stop:215 length:183 start_codon:yes stop_codon:yes gene_type:complete